MNLCTKGPTARSTTVLLTKEGPKHTLAAIEKPPALRERRRSIEMERRGGVYRYVTGS